MKKDFNNRILVSITGKTNKQWQKQLAEVEKYKIFKVALFLEHFSLPRRKRIYKKFLNSCIKDIPLVHIRHDMSKDELIFLKNNYKTKCFTIHEDYFRFLNNWKGFYKKLYLEMNTDDAVSGLVKVKKIGGFCVDLSHFKVEEEKWSKEFEYVLERRKIHKYFVSNHLNGYSYKKNSDLHTVSSLDDFKYLKTLPGFIFGKYIAIEVFNSIKDQLKFKKALVKLLNQRFNK